MSERPDVYEMILRIEARVGGSYEMSDGRKFWIDGPVAREIARRAVDGPSKGIFIRETITRDDGTTRVRTGRA